MKGHRQTIETRLKISQKLKGRKPHPITEETRQKMRDAPRPKLTEEHKRKIGEASKGNTYCLGVKHSIEAKKKMSLSKIGHPVSAETKKKIGDAHRHKIVSLETRNKMSKAKKGQKNPSVSRMMKLAVGDKHPGWKGGYQRKLWHNRNRRINKIGVGGYHTLEQWEELKKKYNYMCLCCKKSEPFITLSEDHIVPISKGGSNDIDNIQPLCRSCNSIKHDKVISYLPQQIRDLALKF